MVLVFYVLFLYIFDLYVLGNKQKFKVFLLKYILFRKVYVNMYEFKSINYYLLLNF